ncbi:MAG: sigma-54-dependent Fis family transcriptional regulator [Moritella sp.]|uniref:sigma-54-dependent transcriptional regulator n=1 Tax=Moritella sp. TaxID=78556 RepID=UPI0025E94520|nr:sigma-54 dependent transcriptional regulator [Moritella sp.]NQZ92377.1 sigma-54-dependent Fis family transcriptional regulator [Moritella sp.]
MSQQSVIQIALIEDDEIVRLAISQRLQLAGYDVIECADGESALSLIPAAFPGIVISDVRLPDISGLALLPQLLANNPEMPIILMTGHGDINMAVNALRDGAFDFLEKPFDPDKLIETVGCAIEKRQLQLGANKREEYLQQAQGLDQILIGSSPGMVELRQQLVKIANIDTNVIIYGDTGCGKELVADCLHKVSTRSQGNFVALNCAAIPEALFESELFGHEAGAFTGAIKKRIGKLEYADKGTLFLDEIESMPLNMQIKMLRILQEKLIVRVGGNKSIAIDVRVIAAAKESLKDNQGFRQDLFYRLNVAQLYLPPLRERGEDILLLFEHYVNLANIHAKPLSGMDEKTLLAYGWPGNVRELINVATRFGLDASLTVADILVTKPLASIDSSASELSLAMQTQNFERKVIAEALRTHKGSIIEVMDILDLPRRTLNQKMQKYDLHRADYI